VPSPLKAPLESSLDTPPAAQSMVLRLPQPTPKRRDELTIEICECLIDIVAALFAIPSKELRQAERTAMPATRVRQIAMYVAHVLLKLSMKEVGRGFGRDRTTVAHACQVVEDLRDDGEFDHLVMVTERVALAAFRNRLEV
jgi:chromosomal replication initiation ATPase DnaA